MIAKHRGIRIGDWLTHDITNRTCEVLKINRSYVTLQYADHDIARPIDDVLKYMSLAEEQSEVEKLSARIVASMKRLSPAFVPGVIYESHSGRIVHTRMLSANEVLDPAFRLGTIVWANRLKSVPRAIPFDHNALLQAVRNLYYAGVWYCDRHVDEVGLWTAVRDAAGFEKGNSPNRRDR